MPNDPTNGGVHLPDSLILEKLDDIKSTVVEFRAEVLGRDGSSGRLPVAEARLNSHSSRLQKLENWKWQIAGGLTVLVYIMEKIIHLTAGAH